MIKDLNKKINYLEKLLMNKEVELKDIKDTLKLKETEIKI
jgi:hypothetical protein